LLNAQHTIDGERRLSAEAHRQAEYFRSRLSDSVRTFRLEAARIKNHELKQSIAVEGQRYEENKEKASSLHVSLRLQELDQQIAGNRHHVPLKLARLRKQAQQLEQQQSSQRESIQLMLAQQQGHERLTTAAQHNDLTACLQLLRMGAEPNFVDAAGYLPLHYACVGGHYETAQLLLEHGSDVSAYLTGHAPLVLAAQHGHVHLLRILLDYGADLEEKGKGGMPAVIAALLGGHYSTMELLLQVNSNM
jgi:hypothetical protein